MCEKPLISSPRLHSPFPELLIQWCL